MDQENLKRKRFDDDILTYFKERLLEKREEAKEQIENRAYGICQATERPIEKGRLDAVPHTRYSLEAKGKSLDKNNGSSF